MGAFIFRAMVNIKLKGERLKAFSLESGTRKDVHFSLLLLNRMVVLVRAIRQIEETRSIQMGKEELKVSF